MNCWITEWIFRGLALSNSVEVVHRIVVQRDKVKGFVKQMGLEEWTNGRSCCQVHPVQDFRFSCEILSPSLWGWLLPRCRHPPGKLTFLNSWHHGEVTLFFLPGPSYSPSQRKRPFSWALPVMQESSFFQLPGYRRGIVMTKLCRKLQWLAMLNGSSSLLMLGC